jgi:hypothetical protein
LLLSSLLLQLKMLYRLTVWMQAVVQQHRQQRQISLRAVFRNPVPMNSPQTDSNRQRLSPDRD